MNLQKFNELTLLTSDEKRCYINENESIPWK